jgi:hypothetical protein
LTSFDRDTVALVSSPSEINEVRQLVSILDDLKKVNLSLPSSDSTVNLRVTRMLFDELLNRYGSDQLAHLTSSHSIVQCLHFENAVVKTQSGDFNLNSDEEKIMEGFLIHPNTSSDKENADAIPSDFVERAKFFANKRARTNLHDNENKYQNLNHICPTSNIVERLFSGSKLIITDHRTSLDHESLDGLLFLRYHKHLWTSVTIEKLLSTHTDD